MKLLFICSFLISAVFALPSASGAPGEETNFHCPEGDAFLAMSTNMGPQGLDGIQFFCGNPKNGIVSVKSNWYGTETATAPDSAIKTWPISPNGIRRIHYQESNGRVAVIGYDDSYTARSATFNGTEAILQSTHNCTANAANLPRTGIINKIEFQFKCLS